MSVKTMGITGLMGAGKTYVAQSLCIRYGAIYCSIGQLYLALVELLRQNGFNTDYLIQEVTIDGLLQWLEKLRLKPLHELNEPLSCLIAYTDVGPINTLKDPIQTMRAVELANIPIVNLRVLELVRHSIEEVSAHVPIIVDGRQAHLIAENSVFMTANLSMRVQRVQERFKLCEFDAVALVHQTDKRDAAMNDEARRSLADRVIDTTNLDRPNSVVAVEYYFKLNI